jgi:hypothetical protein
MPQRWCSAGQHRRTPVSGEAAADAAHQPKELPVQRKDWIVTKARLDNGDFRLEGLNKCREGTIDQFFIWRVSPRCFDAERYDLSQAEISPEAKAMFDRIGVKVFHGVMAYLEAALAKVDSQSVRDWAQTPHNLPLWLKIAERELGRGTDVHVFAGHIVAQAMGL